MERKTDEATRNQMNEAYQQWLDTGSDSGFPFIITIPPENGKPMRYKITRSKSESAV